METHSLFLILGAMFVIGLGAHLIGQRTRVPRVTLLLVAGLIAGHAGWIPADLTASYEFLSITALTLVAFLLGGSLSLETLRVIGKRVLAISLCIALASATVVTTGLILLGAPPSVALVLGGISAATDPAATTDTIGQSGARNDFTRTVEGVVAVDDAWGLVLFSVCLGLAVSGSDTGSGEGLTEVGLSLAYEFGGAVLLGLAIGLPGAALTGRISEGEPLEVEALALVFLTAGAALWAEVSFLVAGMVAGATIVNLAAHHDRAFHEIAHIQWPFMVLFFLLAGALLDLTALAQVGLLGVAYVGLRVGARVLGGWLGAWLSRAPEPERPLYGLALLPQAGVAVGMALIAARALPDHADRIIALTIGTTMVFELVGPALTLWAVHKSVAEDVSPP